MTFPTYSDLVGHTFADVDGAGLTHRHWMGNVGDTLNVGWQSVTEHFTAAEFMAIQDSEAELIAAPGPGKVIFPQRTVTRVVYDSTWYDIGEIGIGWDVDNSNDLFWFVALDQLASFTACQTPFDFSGTGLVDGVVVNAPLIRFPENVPPTQFGTITTSVVGVAGSGYAPGDTGTVDGGSLGETAVTAPATYTVNTVGGGGAVVTYTMTNHDPAYVVQNGYQTTATTGGGSGFAVDVTEIPEPDGEFYLTIFYTILEFD